MTLREVNLVLAGTRLGLPLFSGNHLCLCHKQILNLLLSSRKISSRPLEGYEFMGGCIHVIYTSTKTYYSNFWKHCISLAKFEYLSKLRTDVSLSVRKSCTHTKNIPQMLTIICYSSMKTDKLVSPFTLR